MPTSLLNIHKIKWTSKLNKYGINLYEVDDWHQFGFMVILELKLFVIGYQQCNEYVS